MHYLKQSILKVIAYFDVFDYPVNAMELRYFLDMPFTETAFTFALDQLQNCNTIYRFDDLYSLRNEYWLVERRIKGNQLAAKKLKKAASIAKFLVRFPYVKGIAISGSLSKNFAYKGSDYDFFIITTANRLWVARMFLVVFYKMANMVGFGKYFCLNYFVDEAALEIPERNLYTAIEIATLMPKQGRGIFAQFFEANNWVLDFLPNYRPSHGEAAQEQRGLVKTIAEVLLDTKLGTRLDAGLNTFYKSRWEKMMAEKKCAKNGFLFGSYIAGKHMCKPIPYYFQQKILARFEEKMEGVNSLYYSREQVAV